MGKWHLGHGDRKYWPRQRGFDHRYGPLIGEIDYFTHGQHGVLDWDRNGEPVREEGYSTTLFGNDAVALIEKHDTARPLFLYLAFNAPHTPYQATKEWLDRYANVTDPSRRAYAAQVSALDARVARVVAALQRRANALASVMAKPMLLETGFQALRARLSLPPALPAEPFTLTEP